MESRRSKPEATYEPKFTLIISAADAKLHAAEIKVLFRSIEAMVTKHTYIRFLELAD
jgi:hypothetical protein